MSSKFVIQQYTGHQYEDLPEGEFDRSEQAIASMRELEQNLSWRDMRVVKVTEEPRRDLSGRILTGDDAHEVIAYGRESNEQA